MSCTYISYVYCDVIISDVFLMHYFMSKAKFFQVSNFFNEPILPWLSGGLPGELPEGYPWGILGA